MRLAARSVHSLLFYSSISSFSFLIASAATFNACPLLGAVYPAPTSIPSSSIIQSALSNATDALDTLVTTGNSTEGPFAPANITTWSIGMFSTSDESSDPFWQYHYTAPSVANSTAGVHKADIDSVYRVGSISKLFTVYSLLVQAGDGYWQDPVTKWVPELAAIAAGDAKEGVEDISRIRWEDVTLGDLADQIAGLPRDYTADLINQVPAGIDPTQLGFPPLNASEIPSCSYENLCNRTDFFNFYAKRHPVFLPATTPAYSNDAFEILAFAIEGITNQTVDQILSDSVYKPLNMSRSSLSTPPDPSLAVIPISINSSSYDLDFGLGAPYGAMYSTIRDMTSAGRSMLNSTLLPPAVTRRWFKPGAHTDSLVFSVGKPWEIIRSTINGRVVDVYTKTGNVGDYGSIIALVPDFQVGLTILAAAPKTPINPFGGVQPELAASIIAEEVFPALEQAAKQQATDDFAGTYTATALNSSLVLAADNLPGLNITSLISNGTDFLADLAIVAGVSGTSLRAYPTNLRSSAADGTSQVAFTLLLTSPESIGKGVIEVDCFSWGAVDNLEYGMEQLQQLVFDMDAQGKVVAVENPALRVKMEKNA